MYYFDSAFIFTSCFRLFFLLLVNQAFWVNIVRSFAHLSSVYATYVLLVFLMHSAMFLYFMEFVFHLDFYNSSIK